MCTPRACEPAFLAVRESDAEFYVSRGLRTFYLGDEAILHCDTFSIDGPGRKSLRAAVRRAGRRHRFAIIAGSDASPTLTTQLNTITAKWRGKAPERGFTMSLSQDVTGPGSPWPKRGRRPGPSPRRRTGTARPVRSRRCWPRSRQPAGPPGMRIRSRWVRASDAGRPSRAAGRPGTTRPRRR